MPPYLRTALASATAAVLTGGLLAVAPGATAATADSGAPVAGADFNGDGYADVAVSASRATVEGQTAAGELAIIYGGPEGNRHTTIHQGSPGVPGDPEPYDYFGAAHAWGDFDGDGYDDLITGAPGEDIGDDQNTGTAVILWGSPSGLVGGTTLKDPRPGSHDGFGAPVVTGDFDGDGRTDIAVGAAYGYASVDVFLGGVTRDGTPGSHHVVTPPLHGRFGLGARSLGAGDLDGDGKDDLLVDGYAADDARPATFWLPGTAEGPTTTGTQRLPGGPIGAVGDTDGDGYDEVILGTDPTEAADGPRELAPPKDPRTAKPREDTPEAKAREAAEKVKNSKAEAAAKAPRSPAVGEPARPSELGGSVRIVHGTAEGPAHGLVRTLTPDTVGVPGNVEKGDAFGAALALGDLDGDGHPDLLVGVPGEHIDGVPETGAVIALYGDSDGSGLTGDGARSLHQNTRAFRDENEPGDRFGTAVHLADLDGDGLPDPVIGSAGENAGNGALHTARSTKSRKLTDGAVLYVSTIGISTEGTPELGSHLSG
ncbi:FG-GAP-like repeat-containing protein [Streptomyces albidoflavus]|uniref:FG-GAP-like repeat-containing protein n=1 Tax=Streptomyces albidoflavus TaxID=1886 RepID=UPI0034162246